MQVLLSACLNPEDAPMEDALLRGKPGVHGQSETESVKSTCVSLATVKCPLWKLSFRSDEATDCHGTSYIEGLLQRKVESQCRFVAWFSLH